LSIWRISKLNFKHGRGSLKRSIVKSIAFAFSMPAPDTTNNFAFTKEQLDALSNIAVTGSDMEYVFDSLE